VSLMLPKTRHHRRVPKRHNGKTNLVRSSWPYPQFRNGRYAARALVPVLDLFVAGCQGPQRVGSEREDD
jgi:hypothetical protein